MRLMRQDSQESDKMLLNGSGCNGAPFASWLKKKNPTLPIISQPRPDEEPLLLLLLCAIGGSHGRLEQAYLW